MRWKTKADSWHWTYINRVAQGSVASADKTRLGIYVYSMYAWSSSIESGYKVNKVNSNDANGDRTLKTFPDWRPSDKFFEKRVTNVQRAVPTTSPCLNVCMYIHICTYVCTNVQWIPMLQSDRQEAADQMETEWYFVMLPPPIEHVCVCVCGLMHM